MNDERVKLLLFGKKLVHDQMLINLLQKRYDVLPISELGFIDKILAKHKVHLIVFEFSKAKKMQIQFLKQLKFKIPEVILIAINGSENVNSAAELLIAGATDIFPAPYNPALLVERIEGLLR